MEPSAIIRAGLISVLHNLQGIQTDVFDASDAEQLRHAIGWHKPDILIINPTALGLISLQQIHKEAQGKEMKCIALLGSLADSAMLKPFDETITLYDTPAQIKEKIENLVTISGEEKRHESLSAREKEVVVCVVKGMTNKQIADHLCLSTHTVITHRRNIAAKLQIHSTAGLTIYAIVNKMVELSELQDYSEEI